MTTPRSGATPRRPTRRPPVIIDETLVERLESLASAAMARAPDLADRLLDELSRARLVPPAKLPERVVTLGNRVTWRDETTGEERTATLVLPEEADIDRGRVSVLTPIGVALIGLSEGAQFHWETRDGETRPLTVTRVGPAAPDAP
jgi:regulator of nucleoside diphosphate kinase